MTIHFNINQEMIEQEKTLKEKVEQWVAQKGVSLEYFAANSFGHAGFTTFQGYYVKGTDQSREIDVMAHRTYELGRSRLRLISVAECKWSQGKPWAIFCSPSTVMTDAAVISQTIGNEIGSALFWYMAGDSYLQKIELFSEGRSCGFSGRQVFESDNKDVFYDTIQGVVSKSVAETFSYGLAQKEEMKWIGVAFPLIIVDAPLFEVNYDSTGDQVEANEVHESRLRWRGSREWQYIASVDIVTKNFLPQYLNRLGAQFDQIAERARHYFPFLERFAETGDMSHLKISEVSRGVGQPWFFTTRKR
jgi:hypothetical protein